MLLFYVVCCFGLVPSPTNTMLIKSIVTLFICVFMSTNEPNIESGKSTIVNHVHLRTVFH